MAMERRLAAILAADVVGYTALMGTDEAGTLHRLTDLREKILGPLINEHHGRIVKLMGDGLLVEFASAVDSVACAMAWQDRVAQHEAESDASKILQFRIGINLGDVIAEDGDIHGDGVNIAARLEGLAEPGGICLSDDIYRHAKGKIEARFEDMGKQDLKNVADPVRVYRVAVERPDATTPATVVEPLPLPDKPSIAMLPFDNMSGDPEQEYFADGMTEDIITDLSKASGLFVIARNSSFAYKEKNPDVRQVCQELGVRYVLEGSVRRAGKRVRINAQLIDGIDSGHIWAERYDRDLEDIFVVQDEVTREIVAALHVELTTPELERREGKGRPNTEAYDYFYRGRACMLKFDPKSTLESRRMFERAIELDPGLAQAYAWLSTGYFIDHINGWNASNTGNLDIAIKLARQACELDQNDAVGYAALSLCLSWHGALEEAEQAARRAIELDPNNPNGYSALGHSLDFSGRHEQAAEMFRQAFRLDPQRDFFLSHLGRALFAMGQYAEAEVNFKRRLFRTPESDTTHAYLAALYGIQERCEEAREVWQRLLEINPDYDPEHSRVTLPYRDSNWFDRFYGGLEKAGLLS